MSIPGSPNLIAGTMQAGFFGVVPASELFTGAEISSECGITQGTLQFSDVGWLKFAIDGEIIFKSQKTYRHSISWDHINSTGAVKGTKQVSKGGIDYKVTLMKGALTDPSADVGGDSGAKGSEWNRLMLPIHIEAKDKSWAYPANVETTIPYWGIDFTDADLHTRYSHGSGSYQWCQEVYGPNASNRVYRGDYGVSYSSNLSSSATYSPYPGWSPVLRVVAVPPTINGEDESLGAKTDSFSYNYEVQFSQTATSIVSITEKLNGDIIASYDNPTQLQKELTITKEQLSGLEYFKTHTIEILVTDNLGMSATRVLTFTRNAEQIDIETPLLDVVEKIDELGPYVQGGKNYVGNAITGVDDSVVIPTDPTFQQLVDGIGQISTGKKWASGEDRINPGSTNEMIFQGLSFTPSRVISAMKTNAEQALTVISSEPDIFIHYDRTVSAIMFKYGGGNTSNAGSLLTNGFKLTGIKASTYHDVVWWAYE